MRQFLFKKLVTSGTPTKSHEIGTSKESVCMSRGEVVVGSSNAAYPTHPPGNSRHPSPLGGRAPSFGGPSYFLTKPSIKVKIINYYVIVCCSCYGHILVSCNFFFFGELFWAFVRPSLFSFLFFHNFQTLFFSPQTNEIPPINEK